MLVLNTLPIAVALSLDDRPEHYSAGYFNVLAGRLAGSWLGLVRVRVRVRGRGRGRVRVRGRVRSRVGLGSGCSALQIGAM